MSQTPLYERLEQIKHKAELRGSESQVEALRGGMNEMIQLARQAGQPIPEPPPAEVAP